MAIHSRRDDWSELPQDVSDMRVVFGQPLAMYDPLGIGLKKTPIPALLRQESGIVVETRSRYVDAELLETARQFVSPHN